MDGPRPQHGRIRSTQTPARRRMVPIFHVLIIDRLLYARPVRAERLTGGADFGDLDENLADPVALADPQRSTVQAARSEIFAEGAVIQREALCLELLDAFGGDDEDRLARAAMHLWIRMPVARDTKRSDYSSGDRALRYAAWRNVDLKNRRGMHLLFIIAHNTACRPHFAITSSITFSTRFWSECLVSRPGCAV
jgi:hypothetical protein